MDIVWIRKSYRYLVVHGLCVLFVLPMIIRLGSLNIAHIDLVKCLDDSNQSSEETANLQSDLDKAGAFPNINLGSQKCQERLLSIGRAPWFIRLNNLDQKIILQFALKNYPAIVSSFDEIKDKNQSSPTTRFWTGVAALFDGQVDKARSIWQGIPNLEDFFLARANSFARQGQLKQAKSTLQLGLEIFPQSVSLLTEVTNIFWNNDLEFSIWAIDQLEKLEAPSGPLYFIKARSLIAQGRFTEAEPLLRKAIETPPQDFHYYQSLGYILVQLDRPDEAIKVLKIGITLQPDHPEQAWTKLNLGIAYMKIRDIDNARNMLMAIPASSSAYPIAQEELKNLLPDP